MGRFFYKKKLVKNGKNIDEKSLWYYNIVIKN